MTDFVKQLSELTKDNVALAGGKGASLGEMLRAGVPVPGGFVVTTEAFEHFLSETDLNIEIDSILHSVNTEAMHTVEEASAKIQALITEAELPDTIQREILEAHRILGAPFVAVRSSATAEDSSSAAWAGQLDTFLNVSEADVLDRVRDCFASLFTPRAIFYRFEHGLHEGHVSVAVVVQAMVQSEKSGIAFSVHPVTEDYNQLIIEAGLGLGEAIVSGAVTPDSYTVEKEPRRIIDINVSEQKKALYRDDSGGNEWRELGAEGTEQILTEEQILELSELILKIESHYGFPCDIEWAYEDGAFFITQSRPITTLQTGSDKQTNKESYKVIFKANHVSALFLDLNINENTHDSVITSHNDVCEIWFTGEKIHEIKQHGLEVLKDPAYTKQVIDKLHAYADEFVMLVDGKIQANDFSKEASESVLSAANRFLHEYTSIDNLETEGFGNADENSPYFASLNLILKHKNKLREKMNQAFFEPGSCYERYSDGVAKMLNISRPDLDWYLCDEILSAYADETVSAEELAGRREAYVFVVEKGMKTFLSGGKAKQFIEDFKGAHEVKISDANCIPGTTAYSSGENLVAEVFVLNTDYTDFRRLNEAMDQMPDGAVLVSETTAPELMPAIEKASAIITDIGGQLSHAGITARELKKPCIVDTQVATRVLRTGDLVEVDADSGVVRVLESGAVTMSLAQTREHSLVYAHVWDENNRLHFEEHGNKNIKNVLLINIPGTKRIEAYYDEVELNRLFDLLRKRIEDDPKFIPALVVEYDKHWDVLKPYVHDGKMMESSEELETYYQHYIGWWTPMAVFFALPGIEGITEEVRDVALQMRKKSEKESDALDRVFVENFMHLYPEHESIAYWLTPSEMFALKKDGLSPEVKAKCEERKRSGWVLVNGELAAPSELSELLRKHNMEIEKITAQNTSEIQGVAAFKGKVTGKVFVVREKAQLQDIPKDAVIVAHMTSPDFVPAIKLAKAIVTDEGGITCHAAIVSRELKKPCVIGTKVATQVLKDGDLVEVDADNGVVRKLESLQYEQHQRDYSLSLTSVVWNIFHSESVAERFGHPQSTSYTMIDNGTLYHFQIEKDNVMRAKNWVKKHTDIRDLEKQRSDVELATATLNELLERDLKNGVDVVEMLLQLYKSLADIMPVYLASIIVPAYCPEVDDAILSMHNAIHEEYEVPLRRAIDFERQLLACIERNENLPKKTLEFCTESELREYLNSNVLPEGVLRRKEFVLVEHNRNSERVYYEREKLHELSLVSSVEHQGNLIVGTTAHGGRGQGRVVVVKNIKDADKIDEGTVLVTAMTDPRYVPAMKKVVAIVTDEGGITCHAAIVSRELKKPCVIGTKVATQVLKDGDLVEVNADSGVVRKIEKNTVCEQCLKKAAPWIKLLERRASVLTHSLFREGEKAENFRQVAGLDIKANNVLGLGDTILFSAASLEDMRLAVSEVVERGGMENLKKLADSCYGAAQDLITSVDTASASNEESLEEAFEIVVEKFAHFSPYIVSVTTSEKLLEEKIQELISEKTGKNDEEYFTALTFADKEPEATQEQRALLQLALDVTDVQDITSGRLDKQIEAHRKRYSWIGTRLNFEDDWTDEDFKSRLRQHVADGTSKQKIQNIDKLHQKMKKKTEEFISAYELTDGEKQLVAVVKEFVYLRSFRTEAVSKAFSKTKVLLTRIESAIGAKPGELIHLTIDEIRALLRKEVVIDALREIISERKEEFYYAFCDNVSYVFSGEEKRKIDALYIRPEEQLSGRSENLTGTGSWKGVVTGTVKVVRSERDIHKVERGDVMVSVMTFPNFVPAMEKAGAFVTDEGGILCHAAIVSREMQKPCVIGTKVATQVLKDGDLVEVDADNGVVRKIEEKKEELVRLFRYSTQLPYFLTDMYMQYYKQHECVVVSAHGTWVSYLKPSIVHQLNAKGEELYATKESFEEMQREFDVYIEENKKKLVELTATWDDIPAIVDCIASIFPHYTKTEFFYTDTAFASGESYLNTKEGEKAFEQLKLRGREYLNSLFFGGGSYFERLLSHVAEASGVSREDIEQYSIAELLTVQNEKVSAEVLAERKKAYVFEGSAALVGAAAEKRATEILGETTGEVYKGTAASPGKVTGKAFALRVDIKDFDNLSKVIDQMEKGSILIAETTAPEVIAACKKASAIVTDQGGLMSHAAIVARELGIPCVVGTDTLLSSIETGDQIEVDADSGVVQILK